MTNQKNAKASAPSSERLAVAAQVLLILTAGMNMDGEPVQISQPMNEKQRQAAASLMLAFDQQIGALEALIEGKILDAEQRREVCGLHDGLNELYVFLASIVTGGGHA